MHLCTQSKYIIQDINLNLDSKWKLSLKTVFPLIKCAPQKIVIPKESRHNITFSFGVLFFEVRTLLEGIRYFNFLDRVYIEIYQINLHLLSKYPPSQLQKDMPITAGEEIGFFQVMSHLFGPVPENEAEFRLIIHFHKCITFCLYQKVNLKFTVGELHFKPDFLEFHYGGLDGFYCILNLKYRYSQKGLWFISQHCTTV